MSAAILPLFPLRTVFFPGALLPLRIFETRYIDLVRRSLRDDSAFGVVAIRRGEEAGEAEPFRVGTLARIVDWERTPDGLLGLKVRGERRFRFESVERAPDGLYLGRNVEYLNDETAPVTAGREWALRLLRVMVQGQSDEPSASASEPLPADELADANRVCWNLALRLPLGFRDRQTLLEIDDIDTRLERLRAGAETLFDELKTGSD